MMDTNSLLRVWLEWMVLINISVFVCLIRWPHSAVCCVLRIMTYYSNIIALIRRHDVSHMAARPTRMWTHFVRL